MGAWGTGSFENDLASDWVYALFEPGDHLPHIEKALRAVVDAPADASLDSPTGTEGLAAAEVIAAWLGKPSPDANDTVTVWARAQKQPPEDPLIAMARTVVERVRGAHSELQETWAEAAESYAEWQGVVAGLLERLA